LCGAETWKFRKVDQKYLENFDVWGWRKMAKNSWTDHVRNEEVLLRGEEYHTNNRKKGGPRLLSRYSDCLRDGRSGDRIPVGRDFPHLSIPALRPTQPPVQWVPGLSRGKVRPGCDADPSPPSSAEVKNRVIPKGLRGL